MKLPRYELNEAGNRLTIVNPDEKLRVFLLEATQGAAHIVRANATDFTLIIPQTTPERVKAIRELSNRLTSLFRNKK